MERRQILNVPVTACQIIEHRGLEYAYQRGQSHTSALPGKVTEAVQFGHKLRVLPTQRQLLPFARAAQLIHDLHCIAASPGTLHTWVVQASNALRSTADMIALLVRHAPMLVDAAKHQKRILDSTDVSGFSTLYESILPEREALNSIADKPNEK